MSLKVKLIKSFAGAPDTQRRTIRGVGRWKVGQVRILPDAAAIRGMVFKGKHLVSQEVSDEQPRPRKRSKPRKIALRDLTRAGRAQG